MTILVVEDDQSVLTLIERLLAARGHTVLAAHDPDDASFVLTEHGAPPDLLLTDILFADRNGVEYARTMKAAHPSMKVVFITAWPHREPAALRSGLGPVLRKPFTAQALYDAIDNL